MKSIIDFIRDKKSRLNSHSFTPCVNSLPQSNKRANIKQDFMKSACLIMTTLALSNVAEDVHNHRTYLEHLEQRQSLTSRMDECINIWSYNLRADYLGVDDGEIHSWDNRKEIIVEQLISESPDIICFQELTPSMYEYLSQELDGYSNDYQKRYEERDKYFGQGIFFKSDRFEILDSGKFYLSETPEIESKGWGKDMRICSWVKLNDLNTNRQFYVYNTHLTTHNQEIQENSVKLINERTSQLDAPVILVGDYNCNYTGLAYKETDKYYTNSTDIALDVIDYGSTYQAYSPYPRYNGQPIDFIWLSETNGVCDFEVLKYERENDFTEENFYKYLLGKAPYAPSDHYAVSADVFFKE